MTRWFISPEEYKDDFGGTSKVSNTLDGNLIEETSEDFDNGITFNETYEMNFTPTKEQFLEWYENNWQSTQNHNEENIEIRDNIVEYNYIVFDEDLQDEE